MEKEKHKGQNQTDRHPSAVRAAPHKNGPKDLCLCLFLHDMAGICYLLIRARSRFLSTLSKLVYL